MQRAVILPIVSFCPTQYFCLVEFSKCERVEGENLVF